MMGDAQKEEQETVSPLPRAAVLKAAHHGAANGTDAALLRDVSPDIVILSYNAATATDTRTGRPSPRFAKRSCCASTRRTAPSSCAQTANP